VLSAVLDLDRIRWLRETDEELIVPAPYRTIPGVLKWRRPELYGQLTAQPSRAADGRAATPAATPAEHGGKA
jgi:hypothetical protein